MRVIKVRNASIFAKIGNKTIDVEIRSTKDSYQGVGVNIDGKEVFNWQLIEENKIEEKKKSKSKFAIGEPI